MTSLLLELITKAAPSLQAKGASVKCSKGEFFWFGSAGLSPYRSIP